MIGWKDKTAVSSLLAKDFQPRFNFFDTANDTSIITEENPAEGTER